MPIELAQPGPTSAFPDLEPLIKGTELIGSQQARLYQAQQADADRNALWQQRLQAADMRQQERLDAQSQFIDQRSQNQQQLLGQQGQQQKDLWDYKYTTKQQRDIAQIENNENVMQQRADEALQNAQQAQNPQDAYMWNQRAQQYLQSKNSLTAKKMGIKPVPSPKPPPADLNMEAQNNLFWTAPHDIVASTDTTLSNGQVVPQGGVIPQGQIVKGIPPGMVAKRTKDGWTAEALPEPEYMAQQREQAMKERAAAIDEKQKQNSGVADLTSSMHVQISQQLEHALGYKQKLLDETNTEFVKDPESGKYAEKKVHTYTPAQAEAAMRQAYPGYPDFGEVRTRYQSMIDEVRGKGAPPPTAPQVTPPQAGPAAPPATPPQAPQGWVVGDTIPGHGKVVEITAGAIKTKTSDGKTNFVSPTYADELYQRSHAAPPQAAQPANAPPGAATPAPIATGPTSPPQAAPVLPFGKPGTAKVTWFNGKPGTLEMSKGSGDAWDLEFKQDGGGGATWEFTDKGDPSTTSPTRVFASIMGQFKPQESDTAQSTKEPFKPGMAGGLPVVKNDTDWQQIPIGALYIGPDGKKHRKSK